MDPINLYYVSTEINGKLIQKSEPMTGCNTAFVANELNREKGSIVFHATSIDCEPDSVELEDYGVHLIKLRNL